MRLPRLLVIKLLSRQELLCAKAARFKTYPVGAPRVRCHHILHYSNLLWRDRKVHGHAAIARLLAAGGVVTV